MRTPGIGEANRLCGRTEEGDGRQGEHQEETWHVWLSPQFISCRPEILPPKGVHLGEDSMTPKSPNSWKFLSIDRRGWGRLQTLPSAFVRGCTGMAMQEQSAEWVTSGKSVRTRTAPPCGLSALLRPVHCEQRSEVCVISGSMLHKPTCAIISFLVSTAMDICGDGAPFSLVPQNCNSDSHGRSAGWRN